MEGKRAGEKPQNPENWACLSPQKTGQPRAQWAVSRSSGTGGGGKGEGKQGSFFLRKLWFKKVTLQNRNRLRYTERFGGCQREGGLGG